MHPSAISKPPTGRQSRSNRALSLTKNEAERRQQALQWLKEYPSETVATASRVFGVNHNSLYTLARRPNNGRPIGGQNKILSEHQSHAIHQFIRELLSCGIQPTHSLVYGSICNLKKAYNPDCRLPTQAWFRGWWKRSQLHKIKSKPLSVVRFSAQSEKDVVEWFQHYRNTIEQYDIKKKNILNFDEAGFRIGCPKGHSILVPEDVHDVSLTGRLRPRIT